MNEHPLVPIVRFYLICMMVMVVTWLWPHWALILLGANCFGWWGNCVGGCCGGKCTYCTGAVGNQVQVVIAGAANQFAPSCSTCANFNTTWTLSYSNTGSCPNGTGWSTLGSCPCGWHYSDTTTTATCTTQCNAGFGVCLVVNAAGGTKITGTLDVYEHQSSSFGSAANFLKNYDSGTSLSASADLCTKWNATSFPFNASSGFGCCNWLAATATVTEL